MRSKIQIEKFKSFLSSSSLLLRIVFISSFFLSVVLILVFNFFLNAFFSFKSSDFIIGEPAKSSYVLKNDFSYYNEMETNIAREVKGKLALPVYRVDQELTVKAMSSYDFFSSKINSLLNSALDNELILSDISNNSGDFLILDDIVELKTMDLDFLLLKTRIELERILERGYISDDIKGNGSGLLTVISGESNHENISAVSVIKSIDFTTIDDPVGNKFIKKFLEKFVVINCFYDNEQTKFQKELLLNEVEDVYNHYRQGEVIVKKGIVVSSEDFKRIIEVENSVKKDFRSNILQVLGYIIIIFIAGATLLSKSFVNVELKEKDLVLILVVSTFFVAISVLVKFFYSSYIYLYPMLLPTVLITMLFTFLYSNRIALYIGVLYSFMVLLISDFSVYAFLFSLLLSIIGGIIVHNIERRIDLLRSTAELVGISLLISLFMLAAKLVNVDNYTLYFLVSGISALLYGVLLLVLLPLGEHALKISTCFQLKELCDLNAPVLKSMLIKAPGTYAHSVAVAGMAESAAQHIGANALLAKAGGYYHDIGKIDQPHYFIENQKGGKNIHDDMKPSLSVAVIKSHVKLGIEKAKTIGLPSGIVDIIEQHHGKSKIKFFLNKAQNDNKATNIVDDDFKYGGPNPQNPEAAIVLLADSVEAAVRSLKSPTVSQLHKFIWDIILNKLKDGMLDSCGLTLSDLNIIKDSFVNTLIGYYHSRIEYPSGEDD